MRTWFFRRLARHCVSEFSRGDLRARVLRVYTDDRVPVWLFLGLRGTYEYQLEFARRVKWGRYETFATIRHLDVPTIVELMKLVDRYLNGLAEPREGFSPASPRELWKA